MAKDFGNKLQQNPLPLLVLALGTSVDELAQDCGVRRETMSRVINERQPGTGKRTRARLANTLAARVRAAVMGTSQPSVPV